MKQLRFWEGDEDEDVDWDEVPVFVAVARDRPTLAEGPSITDFDGDGFAVDCGELICCVERQADGTWKLSFDIFTETEEYPTGQFVLRRMVASDALRQQLRNLLGITTRLAGHSMYPSLVGQMPTRPDPNAVLAAMTMLLATVDLDQLFTEPEFERAL